MRPVSSVICFSSVKFSCKYGPVPDQDKTRTEVLPEKHCGVMKGEEGLKIHGREEL